jgi:hypothetical protein
MTEREAAGERIGSVSADSSCLGHRLYRIHSQCQSLCRFLIQCRLQSQGPRLDRQKFLFRFQSLSTLQPAAVPQPQGWAPARVQEGAQLAWAGRPWEV